MPWPWILLGLCQVGTVTGTKYTNDFVVEINATADRVAEIAQLVGMIYQGPGPKTKKSISGLRNSRLILSDITVTF